MSLDRNRDTLRRTRAKLAFGLASAFLAVAILWVGPAAVTAHEQDHIRDLVQQGEILPLETVLSEVRPNYPGKLLDTAFSEQGGYFYELKFLGDDGMVQIVTVDARTGKVVSVR